MLIQPKVIPNISILVQHYETWAFNTWREIWILTQYMINFYK